MIDKIYVYQKKIIMKTIKTIAKLLLSFIIIITSFSVNELPVKADLTGKGYAVLTTEGDLIFFRSEREYDNLYVGEVEDISGSKYSGTVFSNVESGNHGWSNYSGSVYKVYVADNNTIYPMDMRRWFYGCSGLTSADLRGFNTDKVTSMSEMFDSCWQLTNVNLSGLDTSQCTDMSYMFANCGRLTNVNLSGLDTSNVTNMRYMFGNSYVTNLDLRDLDTSSVTDMSCMFYYCHDLANLDLSGFNTSNVTTMDAMFYDCSSLAELDLSSFNTGKVEDMSSMFGNCTSLTSLDLSSFNTSNARMSSMFYECYNLQSIKLGTGFTRWESDGCLPMGTWTNGEISKTETELCEEYPSHANEWAGTWYKGTEPIQPVLVTSVSLDKNSIQVNTGETTQLVAAVLPDNADNKALSWSSNDTSIATVNQNGVVKGISSGTAVITATAKDGSGKFAQCSVTVLSSSTVIYVTSVKLNISSVQIDPGNTLQLTATLSPDNATNKTLTWSSSNTGVARVDQNGLVTAISAGTATITATTTDGTNISASCNVTVSQPAVDPLSGKAYAVLCYYDGYTELVFFRSNNNYSDGFNGIVTDIHGNKYRGRIYADVENRDDLVGHYSGDPMYVYVAGNTIIKPTTMAMWFDNCSGLKYFDGNGFDTSNVAFMYSLFNNCGALTYLDISSFDMSSVQMMDNMFAGCNSLTTVVLGEKFTRWFGNSYLPAGLWEHDGLAKTEKELFSEYPKNATSWAGTWIRNLNILYVVEYDDGDLVFITDDDVFTLGQRITTNYSDGTSRDGYVVSICTRGVPLNRDYWSYNIKRVYTDIPENARIGYINMGSWFKEQTKLEEFYSKGFVTTGTTDMSYMFQNCISLEYLDLSYFDTSGVENMTGMFDNCPNLSKVVLGTGFTKWIDNAYLPEGNWSNGTITKTEKELYEQYPSHASEWAGTWINLDKLAEPSSGTAYALVTNFGEFIFFRSNYSYSSGVYTTVTDINGREYTGTVFTNVENGNGEWINNKNSDRVPWDNYWSIRKVYVADNTIIHPVSMDCWFAGCNDLISFNGKGIDTSNITSMRGTFAYCNSLTELDLSSFDTSKVTDMRMMFIGCSSLQNLDLSKFDTGNVTNMGLMFYNCSSLISLDLSSFNTANIDIYLQSIDTYGMESMFGGCDSLSEVKLGKGFTKWTNDAYLPQGYWSNGNLKKSEIELYQQYSSHAANWSGTWQLTEKRIDPLSGTAYAILQNNGDFIFFRSNNTYTSKQYTIVTDIHGNQFTGTVFTNVENGELADWLPDGGGDAGPSCIDYYVKRVYVSDNTVIKPLSMMWWFSGFNDLESFDSNGIDTSRVTNMDTLFGHCYSLANLDLSNFDTSSVTNMRFMFVYCSALTNLDLSSFNTSNVAFMDGMFAACNSLTDLDLSNFDTRKVRNMGEMFWNCSSLISLDLSSFDTMSIEIAEQYMVTTGMQVMFENCDSLVEIKLGKGFTKWVNNAYLPRGIWVNDSLLKTENELYREYPSHASSWSGIWHRESGALRIAGNNRFETSQNIATMFKDNESYGVHSVILASGDNFADALAGSYLAAVLNAPIILTRAGKETEVNKYIKSILSPEGTIIVLGGTAAVPESCLQGLGGYNITRLAGSNRYLTNLEIFNYSLINLYDSDTILIATGTNYADSLSASATGLPILLVKDSLTNEQKKFLSRFSNKKLVILGGTNAVNSTVESQLRAYGTVSRVSGANRAATSLEIAKKFFPNATTAVIAYSHNFPDGLCGGPLAYQANAPLILTRDNDADATSSYLKSKGMDFGYVLGGKSVISDSLVKKLFGLKSSNQIITYKP